MRVHDVIKLTVGSCAVYFIVAACSAYSEEEGTRAGGDSDAASPSSPASPVPNALAEGFKSGTRLKLRFWEGSDGARQFIDFFDSELQTNCSVGTLRTTDGKVRCLPAGAGSLLFSDSTCKVRAGYVVPKTLDPQPRIGGVRDQTTGFTDFFQLGALANAPVTLYVGGDKTSTGGQFDGCSATTVNANSNFYAIGAPLAPTAFVEMTIKTE